MWILSHLAQDINCVRIGVHKGVPAYGKHDASLINECQNSKDNRHKVYYYSWENGDLTPETKADEGMQRYILKIGYSSHKDFVKKRYGKDIRRVRDYCLITKRESIINEIADFKNGPKYHQVSGIEKLSYSDLSICNSLRTCVFYNFNPVELIECLVPNKVTDYKDAGISCMDHAFSTMNDKSTIKQLKDLKFDKRIMQINHQYQVPITKADYLMWLTSGHEEFYEIHAETKFNKKILTPLFTKAYPEYKCSEVPIDISYLGDEPDVLFND